MQLLDLLLALDGAKVTTDGRAIFIRGVTLTPDLRAAVARHYKRLATMLRRVKTLEGIAA